MNYATNRVAVAIGSNGSGFTLYELDASSKSRCEAPRFRPSFLLPSRIGWPAGVKVTKNQNWGNFATKGYRFADWHCAFGVPDAVIEARLQRLANGMEPAFGGCSAGYLLANTRGWANWWRVVAPNSGIKRAFFDDAAKGSDILEAEAKIAGYDAVGVFDLEMGISIDAKANVYYSSLMINAHGGRNAFYFTKTIRKTYGTRYTIESSGDNVLGRQMRYIDLLAEMINQRVLPGGDVYLFVCEFGLNGADSAQHFANKSRRKIYALEHEFGYNKKGNYFYYFTKDGNGNKTQQIKVNTWNELHWKLFKPEDQSK